MNNSVNVPCGTMRGAADVPCGTMRGVNHSPRKMFHVEQAAPSGGLGVRPQHWRASQVLLLIENERGCASGLLSDDFASSLPYHAGHLITPSGTRAVSPRV